MKQDDEFKLNFAEWVNSIKYHKELEKKITICFKSVDLYRIDDLKYIIICAVYTLEDRYSLTSRKISKKC